MRMYFSLILLVSTLLSCANSSETLEISGGIQIYVHPDEAPAVLTAVRDLQRDLEAVLGETSIIVDKIPESGEVIVVATGDRYAGSQPAVTGWEAHQLYADQGRMVLNGADPRGTIYAIYSFSEMFLGVKPLWFWASEHPSKKGIVRIPDDFRKIYPTPDVKYRAWFPNDRDLIIPWQKLSEENYEAFFETMLRLKLNTLEGGIADKQSFNPPYPTGKEATLARDRGLMVTGHHMLVFGSSYKNWNDYWQNVRQQAAPKFSINDRQSLREFWEFHIDLALKNNLDVIWLVGFRGNRDIPFWEFFPDSPSDDSTRAKVIEEMVQIQIDLLKEKTRKENPLMRITLYNEMSRLVSNNLFHIPDEDSLIHNFVAARRDHFPNEDLLSYSFSDELVGYYMNLQFTSSGSHLAQAEGPHKIEQNYRMVDSISGGNLIFSVVNAGNIREHVLGLSANADMMWNFNDFSANSFLKKFSAMYFGDQFGEEIADLYQDFFTSYWQQKKGDLPGFERQYLFHDLRYARAAEMILTDMEEGKYRPNVLHGHKLDNPDKGSVGYFRVEPEDNGVENQVEAILKGTAVSIAKLEQVTAKADEIYSKLETGQQFFNDNLRGQAYLMLHLNRMLNYLTKAYRETPNANQRKQFLHQSVTELELAGQQLRKAEHVRFTDWYANDRVFGIKNLEKRLKEYFTKIDQQ
ncbi:glycosyl hydrolase 115 family protein [Gaoshiqia sediminis]|nr:glycosyl hydrolase 115 family protein [Gaoshiqia sediminis]